MYNKTGDHTHARRVTVTVRDMRVSLRHCTVAAPWRHANIINCGAVDHRVGELGGPLTAAACGQSEWYVSLHIPANV